MFLMENLLERNTFSDRYAIDTMVMTASSHLSTLANNAVEKFCSEALHYALHMQAGLMFILQNSHEVRYVF